MSEDVPIKVSRRPLRKLKWALDSATRRRQYEVSLHIGIARDLDEQITRLLQAYEAAHKDRASLKAKLQRRDAALSQMTLLKQHKDMVPLLRGAHKLLRQLAEETRQYRHPMLLDLYIGMNNEIVEIPSPTEVIMRSKDLSNLFNSLRELYVQIDDFLLDHK